MKVTEFISDQTRRELQSWGPQAHVNPKTTAVEMREADLDVDKVLATVQEGNLYAECKKLLPVHVAKNRIGNVYILPAEGVQDALREALFVEVDKGYWVIEEVSKLYLGETFKCWCCQVSPAVE